MVQLTLKGKVRLLLKLGIQGVINGQVDRSGRGSGTFVGNGAVGEERGTWQCQALSSPNVAAF